MDMMKAFKRQDQEKAEAAEAKNNLESYIIATRDRVNEEETVAAVTTTEQREELVSDLMDAEDWLYMDGENASVEEFRSKLAALKAKSDPMFERVKEAEERPPAVESAKKFIDVTRQVVAAWNTTKPWINETEKTELLKEVELFESWLDEKVEAQSKKEAHEEPAFKAQKVATKLYPLEAKLAKLKKTPKPKPPPTVTTNTTNTTGTNTTNTTVEPEQQEPVNSNDVVIDPPSESEEGVVIDPPTGEEEDKDEL
jgi:hypoxia up-regulated 1